MTQSGQGEEPSARPAREGIVLPSDGSEPLVPGQSGGVNGSAVPAGGHGGHAVPTGGQAWGRPWGPGQSAHQAPQPAQEWSGGAEQQWNAPQQASAPAPQWGNPDVPQSWESPEPQSGWGGASASPQPQSTPAQPLPPEGAQPLPHAVSAGPLPPAAGVAGLPSPADEGATQYIPPVAAGPDDGATQWIPPVAADEGATQYIPPVGPGALPPETGTDDATRFLGRAGGSPAAGSLPSGADAQATQYLPPVPGQPGPVPYGMPPGAPGDDRHTPAEFDNLFRNDAAAAHNNATQYLPRVDAMDMQGPPASPAGGRRGGGDGRGRSRVPLIAAVGVGIVVLGIGAGAMLSGGGDAKGDNSKNVSATGPAANASGPGSGDPAKQQAVALDKLLADSGNSRGSVIKAVAEVKACQNLGQASGDLRDAAKQRGELVTRLSGLAVDKLPGHGELTAALTNAWRASASADNHYAAWADQVAANKKGCRKGQAHTTGQTAEGNRASGTASGEKLKASRLWNVIARKYGLTQRQPTQL